MSTEDLWSSFLSEAAKPDLPFFPPLPQADAPPPESFDTEFEGLEFEGVELPEDSFLQFRGNTPVFISPSVFTHSTESGYELAASEYSYGYPHSNYSMPLDIAFQNVRVSSEYGGVDTLQNPAYPPFNDLSSFGALPPTPSPSPPLRMGKAQSDYGPSKSRQPHFGVAPDNLSLSRQQPATPTVPPVPPVQVSDKQSHAGHGKAHQCPNCSRAFARAFNLKTHMDTHNPERVKQYVCPHSSCKRPFSRKHDLQRHRTAIHRDQSSTSLYSDSSRVSNPPIGVTAGSRAWCDKCGKGRVRREGGCDCIDVK
ncbi:hypothetical protein BGY98DRAFT_952249 [Russula aff. rugulosa BPL654]|nr:hypothetical protein BGY98DRAFT_952249 [Russula aff. rugulosa BPL654]